jgi:hypothetical protein
VASENELGERVCDGEVEVVGCGEGRWVWLLEVALCVRAIMAVQ